MQYTLNACVALHRNGSWLLTVRAPHARHAADTIGLVGGHVEATQPGLDVLEDAARREAAEEVAVDLTGQELAYLESVLFVSDSGATVVNVTFLAELAEDAEPRLSAPHELSEIGWWTLAELAADPRCPPWTLRTLQRAEARLG